MVSENLQRITLQNIHLRKDYVLFKTNADVKVWAQTEPYAV